MPIKNYTTKIAVEKTMGECIAHLSRRGVLRVSALYSETGVPQGIGFVMRTEYGYREFQVPVRTEGVLAALQADKATTPAQRTPEQAGRVAWRIAQDWLETVVALIEADITTLDEVMMPYMVSGQDGRSMFATYRDQQLALTS